jgi:small subunit ribosomal protein S6
MTPEFGSPKGQPFSEKIMSETEGHFMSLYEHVFIARQDLSPQQVEEMTTLYKGIIEQNGGKVPKAEYWGVKSLSFRMHKNRKAHFTLFNIDASPAAVKEMERQEGISEDVLRFLTIRVEALEEGPSAMMRKADRDRERDERDGRDGRRGGGGGRGRDRDDDRDSRRPRDDEAAGDDLAAKEE